MAAGSALAALSQHPPGLVAGAPVASAHSVVIVGDPLTGKQSLLRALKARDDGLPLGLQLSADAQKSGAVAAVRRGLGYTFLNAPAAAPDVTPERRSSSIFVRAPGANSGSRERKVSVWSTSDARLLRFALNPATAANAVVVILLDMSRPWTALFSLGQWVSRLRSHMADVLRDMDERHVAELMDDVGAPWRDYAAAILASESGPGDENSSDTASTSADLAGQLPGLDVEVNLALPLVVVGTKSDKLAEVQAEQQLSDADLEALQTALRRACLSLGASLLYVSSATGRCVDLLHDHLMMRLANRDADQGARISLSHPADGPGSFIGGPGQRALLNSLSPGAGGSNSISPGRLERGAQQRRRALFKAGGRGLPQAQLVSRDEIFVPAGWDSAATIAAVAARLLAQGGTTSLAATEALSRIAASADDGTEEGGGSGTDGRTGKRASISPLTAIGASGSSGSVPSSSASLIGGQQWGGSEGNLSKTGIEGVGPGSPPDGAAPLSPYFQDALDAPRDPGLNMSITLGGAALNGSGRGRKGSLLARRGGLGTVTAGGGGVGGNSTGGGGSVSVHRGGRGLLELAEEEQGFLAAQQQALVERLQQQHHATSVSAGAGGTLSGSNSSINLGGMMMGGPGGGTGLGDRDRSSLPFGGSGGGFGGDRVSFGGGGQKGLDLNKLAALKVAQGQAERDRGGAGAGAGGGLSAASIAASLPGPSPAYFSRSSSGHHGSGGGAVSDRGAGSALDHGALLRSGTGVLPAPLIGWANSAPPSSNNSSSNNLAGDAANADDDVTFHDAEASFQGGEVAPFPAGMRDASGGNTPLPGSSSAAGGSGGLFMLPAPPASHVGASGHVARGGAMGIADVGSSGGADHALSPLGLTPVRSPRGAPPPAGAGGPAQAADPQEFFNKLLQRRRK
eukprot:jgi/Mesvir1/19938/Mv13203-RA.1